VSELDALALIDGQLLMDELFHLLFVPDFSEICFYGD
jgi:hypothetical protein